MIKLSAVIKIIVGICLTLGSLELSLAGDFKLPDYQYEKSKEPILLVDKLPLKGDIKINFDFSLDKNYDSDKVSRYQGLFGTGELNSGLRIEIDRVKQIWALVIGDASGNYTVYDLGKLPNKDVWTKVKIQVSEHNVGSKDHLIILVNDKKIFDDKINYVDSLTNKITIGSGFTLDRKFIGSIRNFTISR